MATDAQNAFYLTNFIASIDRFEIFARVDTVDSTL